MDQRPGSRGRLDDHDMCLAFHRWRKTRRTPLYPLRRRRECPHLGYISQISAYSQQICQEHGYILDLIQRSLLWRRLSVSGQVKSKARAAYMSLEQNGSHSGQTADVLMSRGSRAREDRPFSVNTQMLAGYWDFWGVVSQKSTCVVSMANRKRMSIGLTARNGASAPISRPEV